MIGLATGKTEFSWAAGTEFFESFGNQDIVAADVRVKAEVFNHGATVDVKCSLEGVLTVPCDRCLDELEIPVSTGFEESYVPEGEDLDLSQDVYDYACLALPLQRVHEDGQCNPEAMKYLSK